VRWSFFDLNRMLSNPSDSYLKGIPLPADFEHPTSGWLVLLPQFGSLSLSLSPLVHDFPLPNDELGRPGLISGFLGTSVSDVC